MPPKRLIAMGLPGAGKTTFLAALWYVVESAKVAGALQLVSMPENRQYLNEIRRRWVGFADQDHTPVSIIKEVTLLLDDKGAQAELTFPDMSGESFEAQWTDRQWTKEYDSLAREASGAIVFIHPGKLNPPTAIPEEVALGTIVGPVPAKPQNHKEIAKQAQDEQPWKSRDCPTQVKLIDLLQFLTVAPVRHNPFPVSVVISAWDLVVPFESSPGTWLGRCMPMLDQYLRAHSESLPSRIFGISAIGGDLGKDLVDLKKHTEPSDRIMVAGTDTTLHDISAPIRWIISQSSS